MTDRCKSSSAQRSRWLLVLLIWPVALTAAGDRLRVQYFNVGQGDAALVTCPDGTHHLLIDSGDSKYPNSQKNFKRELSAVLPLKSKLDFAVASHPHSDHIGGMLWVLNEYQVGTYIDNGRTAETATWSRINELRKRQVKNNQLAYINGKTSSMTTLKLCDKVSFTLITPSATVKLSDRNDQSLGVRVDYKQKSFLFVGDMEDKAEEVWLDQLTPEARALADADVLKVGHHGSNTSSTMHFIQAVSPDIAVVSCGARGVGTNIRYKHPRTVTVNSYTDWFKNHHSAAAAPGDQVWAYNKKAEKWNALPRPAGLLLTVNDGNITVETDGKELFVTDAP
jgi:competence protein ComEC